MSNTHSNSYPNETADNGMTMVPGYRVHVTVTDGTTAAVMVDAQGRTLGEATFPAGAVVAFLTPDGEPFNIVDPAMGFGDEDFHLGQRESDGQWDVVADFLPDGTPIPLD